MESKKRPAPTPTFVLRGHTAPVYCCSFASGGKMLASGAGDGSLMLWDTEETRRCLVRFSQAHGDKAVNAVCFASTQGDERLWTQGRDGCVRQWDLEQQVCVSAHELGSLGFVPMSLCVTAAGSVFAALPDGGDPKSVLLLALDARAKDVRVAQHWTGRDRDGMCMRLHVTERKPSGRVQVFCGYEGGLMAVREADGPETFVGLPDDAPAMPLTALTVDGASGMGCVGGAEKTLFPFAVADAGQVEFGATRHVLPKPGVNDIALRDDLKVFASAGWDGRVRCWAAKKNPRPLCVCAFHEQPVNCVSFRPRSSVLAAGSSDGKISLWDVLK